MVKWILIVVPMLLANVFPASADSLTPSGIWMRSDGNAKVRITNCGANICATNVWVGDTSGGEAVGDKLVMMLKPRSANVLDGTAYDVKRKLTYSMTLRVAADRLETRGCIIKGVICKNARWTPSK